MKKKNPFVADELNFVLKDANIVRFNFDNQRQTVYLTFEIIGMQKKLEIFGTNIFLFAFKNIGRLTSFLTSEKHTTAIRFVTNKIEENKNHIGNSFKDNELIFKYNEGNVKLDLVINKDFENQHNVYLLQENKDKKKLINIKIWFEQVELFDSDLKQLDIMTFVNMIK